MANPSLDFGAGESAEPAQDAPPERPAQTKPPAKERKPAKPPAAVTSPTKPAKPAVVCQRCNVDCEPLPGGRNFVRCPKCGWKHKTFNRLVEARKALRANQNKSAR